MNYKKVVTGKKHHSRLEKGQFEDPSEETNKTEKEIIYWKSNRQFRKIDLFLEKTGKKLTKKHVDTHSDLNAKKTPRKLFPSKRSEL